MSATGQKLISVFNQKKVLNVILLYSFLALIMNDSLKFECPDGYFQEEISSQLYFEDIDGDSELYLIRMPSDINPQELEKQKVILTDQTSTTLSTSSGTLECFTDNTEISNLCLILPHKNDKKFSEVKKVFKGSILITEGPCINNEIRVKLEDEENLTESSAAENKKSKKKRDKRNERES